MGSHEWNYIYVDDRWVHIDSMLGEFDFPIEEWSKDHLISSTHKAIGDGYLDGWEGSFTIKDSVDSKIVYYAEQLPLFSKLPTDIGISPDGLYRERSCDNKIDSNTWVFDYTVRELWTKTHTVVFYDVTESGSRIPYYLRKEGSNEMAYLSVTHGQPLPPVPAPTRAGYTFIGWKDLNGNLVGTNPITGDLFLEAVYQKGKLSHKVTFNSNGGTAVKDLTISPFKTINKPVDPIKQGYRFTGWYKDNANTKPWDFSKDQVSQNTTLYAGWANPDTVTALPTNSGVHGGVMVSTRSVLFEAYTIDGNNYFKLRDLAESLKKYYKKFDVRWDNTKNAINLISATPYTSIGGELVGGDGKPKEASKSTATVYKDGVKTDLTAYTIGGNNFFKLRDIGEIMDINILWDDVTKTIIIDPSRGYGGEVKTSEPIKDEMTKKEEEEEEQEIYLSNLYAKIGKLRKFYEELNLVEDVKQDITSVSDIKDVEGFIGTVYNRYQKKYKGTDVDLIHYITLSLETYYILLEEDYPKTNIPYVDDMYETISDAITKIEMP